MMRNALFLLVISYAVFCLKKKKAEPSIAEVVARSQEALDQGDPSRAFAVIAKAINYHPDTEQLRLQQDRTLLSRHRDGQSIAIVSAILRSHAADRDSKLLLAQIYGYEDRYGKSDGDYYELLKANSADE